MARLVWLALLLLAMLSGSAQGATLTLLRPGALGVAPDGGLYIADVGRDQILERSPNGNFRVIAGTGKAGFSGDGGQAVDARIDHPSAMVVGLDGKLYFADEMNNRVRAVTPSGRILTVVGDGKRGWIASGTRALGAGLGSPTALTFGPDGLLYIAASDEILRLNRNGTLTRIAGIQSEAGVFGVGDLAIDASVDGPTGLAFDRRGDLFIAGGNTKNLLMIDPKGRLRLPIGMTGFYPRGTGGLVTNGSGNVLAMQTQTVVELGRRATKTVYNFGNGPVAGIRGFLPNGIAVSPSRTIYVDTDLGNGWATGTALVALSPNHRLSVLAR